MLQQLRGLLVDHERLRQQLGSYLFEDDSLERLSERERLVLELRYGLEGKDRQTLEEVAERLNISRERASRIESEALERLREVGRSAWFLGECTSSLMDHVRQQIWEAIREWFQAQRPRLFQQTQIEVLNRPVFVETVHGQDGSYITYYRNLHQVYWLLGILDDTEDDEQLTREMHQDCVEELQAPTAENHILWTIFGDLPDPNPDSLRIRVDSAGQVEAF